MFNSCDGPGAANEAIKDAWGSARQSGRLTGIDVGSLPQIEAKC